MSRVSFGVGHGASCGRAVSCRVVSYCIVSCRVVSYCIVSCRVVSCRIVSCRVVSCRIVLCRIVSYRVVSCRVLSGRVGSCRVVSYCIVSCRVVSYRVVSCRVVSCRVVLYRVVSCRIVSCRVVSCRVGSCRVVSCRVVSCRIVSCRIVSCRVVSCRVVLYRVVSCRIVSCRVVSCRVGSGRVVSCRVVSCRVVSCRVVSYCIVSYRVVSCRVVSYCIVSCRVVSCRVLSCPVGSGRVVSCRVVSCRVVSCRARAVAQVMSPLEAGPFFGDLSRLEATDKIALSFEHGSAIYGRGDRIDLPIMFEVKARSGRKSHCAVFDFLTGLPPEVAIVPKWVMDDLGIRERDPVRVRGVRLDLVQFVKIQPHSVAFYEAVRESGVEAAVLLRESLSRFSALTEDTAIPIEIGRQAHDVHIVALEPKGAVRIIDQDMSADFEFKVDFEPAPNLEDEAETRARQEELRARQAEQDERKAAAAAAAQEKRAAAIRGRFERARDGAREAAGADDGTEGEVQLRLRLPTGAAVEGAFREGAPVTALVALVLGTDWAEGCSPWGLQLLCGFPRRTLAEGDTVTKDMHRTTISVQEERPPDDDDAVLAAALPPPPAPPPPAAPGAAGGGLARALWAAVFGAAGEDEVAAPGWVREGSRDEAVRRGSADAQALGACPPLDEAVLQAQTVKMFEVQRFVQAGLAPEEARRRAEAGDTAPPGLRPQPEALPPPARSRVPPPPPRPPSPPRDDLARQVSDVRRYTGAPDALATQFLEQNGWDTERAVNAFFDAM